jgi:Glycine-zipper domain
MWKEAIMGRRRMYRWSVVYALPLALLLADGCKKTEPAAPAPQPAAVPASTVPPAPTQPVPTFSAAQTIGMFVYPKATQTHDQQLIDESDCYNSVQQQTGINPKASGPQAPSSADQNAAAQQGAAQAQQAQGGRVRGAARGAAGGAAIGAITGNAGRGAAIGATVGTVRGGRRQRQANEEAKETGAQAAVSQQQQAYGKSKAAYNQQMSTFKRGFSACMDARGYSVK